MSTTLPDVMIAEHKSKCTLWLLLFGITVIWTCIYVSICSSFTMIMYTDIFFSLTLPNKTKFTLSHIIVQSSCRHCLAWTSHLAVALKTCIQVKNIIFYQILTFWTSKLKPNIKMYEFGSEKVISMLKVIHKGSYIMAITQGFHQELFNVYVNTLS